MLSHYMERCTCSKVLPSVAALSINPSWVLGGLGDKLEVLVLSQICLLLGCDWRISAKQIRIRTEYVCNVEFEKSSSHPDFMDPC